MQSSRKISGKVLTILVGLVWSSEEIDLCWNSSSETTSCPSSSSLSSELRDLYFEECLVEPALSETRGAGI